MQKECVKSVAKSVGGAYNVFCIYVFKILSIRR
nr:MAG TPA: hypothetical protein [Caudoviricetes sp.]